jgi:hypothetical protein
MRRCVMSTILHARTARVNKKLYPNAREHALIVGDMYEGDGEVAIRVSVLGNG